MLGNVSVSGHCSSCHGRLDRTVQLAAMCINKGSLHNGLHVTTMSSVELKPKVISLLGIGKSQSQLFGNLGPDYASKSDTTSKERY